jgi:hypothetical protein
MGVERSKSLSLSARGIVGFTENWPHPVGQELTLMTGRFAVTP